MGSHTDHSMDFRMHPGPLGPQGFDPSNGKGDTATCDTHPLHQVVVSVHPHSRSFTDVGWRGHAPQKRDSGKIIRQVCPTLSYANPFALHSSWPESP